MEDAEMDTELKSIRRMKINTREMLAIKYTPQKKTKWGKETLKQPSNAGILLQLKISAILFSSEWNDTLCL